MKSTRVAFGSCCGMYVSIVLVRVDFSVNNNLKVFENRH